jgi:nucleoside-diphosphate-sugar epimerase
VFGSTGELLARSQRMSNDKLRQATGWTPRYRSAREGWRDLAATLEDAAVSRAVD